MSTLEHPLIDRFLDTLWLEKGLTDNTHEAYRNDLQQFNAWFDGRGLRLGGIGRDAILDHLVWRLEQGYKARSTTRFLSDLRGFYRYCLHDGLIAEDPTLQVDLPQLGKPLPKSLSEANVEALLTTPEVDGLLGLRDRTILEVLYTCGLRVSELVGLTLKQVNLCQGVVKVLGKGSKERLVPLGKEAVGWPERYLREARGDLLGGRPNNMLFPSLRGEQTTRQTFRRRIKHYAQVATIGTSISSHTLRHAFVTHLLNHDADLRVVQMLLSHSDLLTTQIYAHIARARLQDLHACHHPQG